MRSGASLASCSALLAASLSLSPAHAAGGLVAPMEGRGIREAGAAETAVTAASVSDEAVAQARAAIEAPRIHIGRAADQVGVPVYYSRPAGSGRAGMVAISSRPLPPGAMFSRVLPPPRGFPGGDLTGPAMSGTLPSAMPVAARAITSGFGSRQHPVLGTWRTHSGLDLAAAYGSPIVATSDGVVSAAGWAGGYGLLVAVDHGGGLQTRYGHMSRLAVVPGQAIRKGSVIGYVGSTGLSTGPHLHYEIRINGTAINPAAHLGTR